MQAEWTDAERQAHDTCRARVYELPVIHIEPPKKRVKGYR